MRKRPKQPKWIKAFKRKVRTSSYLENRAYELFAERMGVSIEEIETEFPRKKNPLSRA